jgi:hypothetical protein
MARKNNSTQRQANTTATAVQRHVGTTTQQIQAVKNAPVAPATNTNAKQDNTGTNNNIGKTNKNSIAKPTPAKEATKQQVQPAQANAFTPVSVYRILPCFLRGCFFFVHCLL